MKCQWCHEDHAHEDLRMIDNNKICVNCLFENHLPFKIYPIGYVENQLERSKSFYLKGDRSRHSKIVLFESQKPFLYKLNDEKWIDVVYYLNQQRTSINSQFHRGIDNKLVGVFASRTPDRLTPIAITNVELIKIEGTILFVRGLDAINHTPVLDIKLGMNNYNFK